MDRRQFLAAPALLQSRAATSKPNILFLMADQHRGDCVRADATATFVARKLGFEIDKDLDEVVRGKVDFDVVGHYARPDVFQLTIRREPKPPIRFDA